VARGEDASRLLLTAEWRHLVMLHYEIDPDALRDLVPRGTELDEWNGRTLVSMVGFLFRNTRFLGLSVPFHRTFEEVNLRFYVRRRTAEGWKRAVVFVRELVPRALIAWMARRLYNENYSGASMGHRIESGNGSGAPSVSYWWTVAGRPGRLDLVAKGSPAGLREGSEEHFLSEHYWGYARQRDGGTIEYRVEHPPWRIWPALSAELRCDAANLYGTRFAGVLSGPPRSAFLAEGSAVHVYRGERLEVP
jgi:uncharacterized protein YqjF (DUF2071 family)